MKVKFSKEISKKIIVPVDGLIELKDGIADVSVRCATVLVKGNPKYWSYVKNHSSKNEDDAEKDTDDVEKDTNDVENDTDDRQKLEEHLGTLSFDELKGYAKEAGFPEEEYSNLNSKKLLKAYLLNKFDESANTEVSK